MKMKYITRLNVMLLLFVMLLLVSCSKDADVSYVNAPKEAQGMNVRLDVARTVFDSQGTTRSGGSGTGWEDGETVYLWFDNGTVKGTAVFKSASNDWEVRLSGNLSRDVAGKVEAYYFDSPVSSTSSMVSMDAKTGVYHTNEGNYKTYANGDVDIVLTLKPITGRIRFAGQSGVDIEVEGLKYYTGYDVANNQLTTSTVAISGTVATNGYTPYYYCEFAENNRQLSVYSSKDGEDYVKSFGASVLTVGESGHVTIPTERTDNGWTEIQEKEFTVTGNEKTVTFNMRKVKKGTFQMGQSADGNDETPVHSVTLTKSYYIGETEVTQGLWYAVMGQKPTTDGSAWTSSYGLGDNYPAYYISYEDCEKFIAKLNQLTGQNFRFPTEAEWEFAAKGGNKSKGYTYAGSNTVGDVAWYTVNSYDKGSSSSDYGTHAVKTKAANELGLYDMSGNVGEWCYDWYGSYSSSAQTDPTGATTGSYRVSRDGGWRGLAMGCRCTYRSFSPPSYRGNIVGFRLAL